MRLNYPATLTPDTDDGGFVVTFRDWPEAITQGDTRAQALTEAADCLEEAVAARIDDGREIPTPSARQRGEHGVSVPLQMALKAALYRAVRESGLTQLELAHRMGINEKEARRLLDPNHASKTDVMERALQAVGFCLSVDVREAA